MANDCHQEFLVTVISAAEDIKFVVFIALNLGCGVAHHHMCDIFGFEALPEGENRLDGSPQLLAGLYPLLRLETVVTVATIILFIALTEIVQQ